MFVSADGVPPTGTALIATHNRATALAQITSSSCLNMGQLGLSVSAPLKQARIHGHHSYPDLRVKSGLHGVSDPLAVPLNLLHLFILLSYLPVNLTLNSNNLNENKDARFPF
ncbi:unnamed protein product [Boreogadus saida]